MSNYLNNNTILSYRSLMDMGIGLGPYIFLIDYFGIFSFILISLIFTAFFAYILYSYFIISNIFVSSHQHPDILLTISSILALILTAIILWIFGVIAFHKIKTRTSWPGLVFRFCLGFGILVLMLWLFIINCLYAVIAGILLLLIYYLIQEYLKNKVTEEISGNNSLALSQSYIQILNISPENELLKETFLGGDYKTRITDCLINDIEKNIEFGEVEIRKGNQEGRFMELHYHLNILKHNINNMNYDKLLITQNKVNALRSTALEADRLENLIRCEKFISERNKAHLLSEIAHYKASIAELLTLAGNMKMKKDNSEYSDFDY